MVSIVPSMVAKPLSGRVNVLLLPAFDRAVGFAGQVDTVETTTSPDHEFSNIASTFFAAGTVLSGIESHRPVPESEAAKKAQPQMRLRP